MLNAVNRKTQRKTNEVGIFYQLLETKPEPSNLLRTRILQLKYNLLQILSLIVNFLGMIFAAYVLLENLPHLIVSFHLLNVFWGQVDSASDALPLNYQNSCQ